MHLLGVTVITHFGRADENAIVPRHDKHRPSVSWALDVINAMVQLSGHLYVRPLHEFDRRQAQCGCYETRDCGGPRTCSIHDHGGLDIDASALLSIAQAHTAIAEFGRIDSCALFVARTENLCR